MIYGFNSCWAKRSFFLHPKGTLQWFGTKIPNMGLPSSDLVENKQGEENGKNNSVPLSGNPNFVRNKLYFIFIYTLCHCFDIHFLFESKKGKQKNVKSSQPYLGRRGSVRRLSRSSSIDRSYARYQLIYLKFTIGIVNKS